MDPGGSEPRSPVWGAVAELVERSRRTQETFDPETGTPRECAAEVAPIVRLYADAKRRGIELSAVERSLLEGVLNDWLRSYAVCRGFPTFEGTVFSVHEVAVRVAEEDDVRRGIDRLFERR